MSSLPPEGTSDAQIRLALISERLTVLIETNKARDTREESWRSQTSAAIQKVSDEVLALKASHRELGEKVGEVEAEVQEIKAQVKEKLSIAWFTGVWQLLFGFGVLVTACAGVVTILKTLGMIH